MSKVESKDSTDQLSSFIFWLFSKQLQFTQLINDNPIVNSVGLLNLDTLQKEHSWLVNRSRDFVIGYFTNNEGFDYLVYGKKESKGFDLEIYQLNNGVINIINTMKVKYKGTVLFSSSGSNVFFTKTSTHKYKTICDKDFIDLSFEEHTTNLIDIFNLTPEEII